MQANQEKGKAAEGSVNEEEGTATEEPGESVEQTMKKEELMDRSRRQ